MTDFVKSVLVFVLIVTVMKGIINNDSFRMYFRFFSGMVLILLMATPLINLLLGGNDWYKLLEEAVFHFELDNINDELNIADGKFEEIIRDGCKDNIEKEIKKMAKKRNLNASDIRIIFDNNSDSIKLLSVDIGLDITGNTGDKSSSINDIEEININTIDAMSDGEEKNKTFNRLAEGKDVKNLREDISSYFLIKEEAVNIWE